MLDTKTDKKNVELSKLIAQLRDHIDIERIIGLNADIFQAVNISKGFIFYLQKSAQESLAIYFCKIFECSGRHESNSIHGIIDSLPPTPLPEGQKTEFSTFGSKYGNCADPIDAQSYLRETIELVSGDHDESLARLKKFRDKIGAHSDSIVTLDSLPSHAEYEKLYGFATDFYDLVSRSMIGSGPARIPRTAGPGFIRLMNSMGVSDLQFNFPDD